MTIYVANISGPAAVLDTNATARTWQAIESNDPDSVFLYPDTASSRAGITNVTRKLELRRIVIAGVGGTGSYVLDLTAKKQGRLFRPRGDLFIQHFLASRLGQDIPIKHLNAEYWHWIERARPFDSITAELVALSSQGDHFRRIIAPAKDDIIYPLCSFLESYDIRTAYPKGLRSLDLGYLARPAMLEVNQAGADRGGVLSSDLPRKTDGIFSEGHLRRRRTSSGEADRASAVESESADRSAATG